MNNNRGEIIESGMETMKYIEKKGLFDHYLGWIRNELQ